MMKNQEKPLVANVYSMSTTQSSLYKETLFVETSRDTATLCIGSCMQEMVYLPFIRASETSGCATSLWEPVQSFPFDYSARLSLTLKLPY